MKKRVVWIEEGALDDLKTLTPPVYMNGKYDLEISENATTGLSALLARDFSAAVVDVRLPPGEDPLFTRCYYDAHKNIDSAKLGFRILERVLGKLKAPQRDRPAWIARNKFGVLTVERKPDIQSYLDEYGIEAFCEKNDSNRCLLELIEEIIRNSSQG